MAAPCHLVACTLASMGHGVVMCVGRHALCQACYHNVFFLSLLHVFERAPHRRGVHHFLKCICPVVLVLRLTLCVLELYHYHINFTRADVRMKKQ